MAAGGLERKADAGAFPANLPGLTSVRFVLALGVVLFHYQLQWRWDAMAVTGLLDRARLGVDVFFILSGFVLTHAYRAALEAGTIHYPRFLAARIARIYPAHLAVLALVVLMVLAARALGVEFDQDLYNPAGFVMTLLLVQSWAPDWITAEWNGPSWSLSAEWFVYLLFPVFAWIGLRLRDRPGLLLLLSGVLFVALDVLYRRLFGDTVVHAEARMGILRIIPEFLYGIALYRLGQKLRPSARWAIAASVGFAALLLLAMHFKVDDRLVVVAAGPLVLSLAMLSKAGADQALARPWMINSGEASYALYLVHFPVLIAWKGLHSILTGRTSAYVLDWWEVGALLVLTLAAAFAIHYLVEAPARSWLRSRAEAIWPLPSERGKMEPGSQPPDV